MSDPAKHFYEFGPFRLDTTERLLLRDGRPVPLTPKAYEMLLALVQKSGHIVEKEELLKEVWPDSFVDEGNLTQHVFWLRKALGENREEHHYIETIPRRGYRFVASVQELLVDASGAPLALVQSPGSVTDADDDLIADSDSRKGAKAQSQRKTWNSTRAFVTAGVLIGLTAGSLFLWSLSKKKETFTSPQVKSIAVLPFRPIAADDADNYLGLGMADALITKLSNIKQITVRPTSAVREYTKSQPDSVLIGRKLGVDAVVDGNMQRAGERIRVTVQLIDIRNGLPFWSESFDERFTNVFAVQDVISERVAGALGLKLTPEERERLRKRYTENPEAFQAYSLGRYFFDRSGVAGAMDKAIDYYQQAIKLDPGFARAYAGLADAYSLDLGYPKSSTQRIEAHDKVQAAVLKALEIDDTLADAHTALGRLRFYDWDWAGAESEYERAILLDANYATAHSLYGWYLETVGRTGEGLAEKYRAVELDPLSINANTSLGASLTALGQYDRAIGQLQKTIALSPTSVWPRIRLAQAYEMKEDRGRAISEFQKAIDLFKNPGSQVVSPAEIRLGQAYAFWGDRAEAAQIIEKCKRRPSHNADYDLALIYIGLGKREEAFQILEMVYENHDMNLLSIVTDPRLASFRSDSRYSDLTRRIGLNP